MISVTPIILGIVIGLVYTMISVGYTLIYGVALIVNLAHGAMIMLGSYFLFSFFVIFGLNIPVSISLTIIVMVVIGLAFERLLTPFKERGEIVVFGTLAIAVLLEYLPMAIWGSMPLLIPSFIRVAVALPGVELPAQYLISGLIAIVSLVMIWLFIAKAKTGLAIRFVAEDPELAMLVGVNVKNIYRVVWGLASACAGLGGCLLGGLFGVSPGLLWIYLLRAWAIVMLGGLGSILGAAVASLILGLAETLFAYYFASAYKDLIYFGVIMAVLFLRPYGLFGKKVD